MCRWGIDIYICGHWEYALREPCEDLVCANDKRVAVEKAAGATNVNDTVLGPCARPTAPSSVELRDVELESYRCGGRRSGVCKQPTDMFSWAQIAGIAVEAFLFKANDLKANADRVVKLLGADNGKFRRAPIIAQNHTTGARATIYNDRSFTCALLNHPDVAGPFYRVLTALGRIQSDPMAYVTRLQRSLAAWQTRGQTIAPAQQSTARPVGTQISRTVQAQIQRIHHRAGNTTAGNTTAGNTTAGNTTAGSTTAGNTTAGNTTAGSTTAGNAAAGNAAAIPDFLVFGRNPGFEFFLRNAVEDLYQAIEDMKLLSSRAEPFA